jgi:hypothetical protein
MADVVRFLGKHFGVVVPDHELSPDETYVLAAARRRIVKMIRFPDGKLAPCSLDDPDFVEDGDWSDCA